MSIISTLVAQLGQEGKATYTYLTKFITVRFINSKFVSSKNDGLSQLRVKNLNRKTVYLLELKIYISNLFIKNNS